MLELLVGAIGGAFGMGIVVLIVWAVKRMNSEEVEVSTTPPEVISEKNKEYALKNYSGQEKALKFSEDITGLMKDLHVQYVDVYGTRYSSIKEALLDSVEIPNEIRADMKQFDAELSVVRVEKHSPRRPFRVEKAPFTGEVYIYEPCMITVVTDSRKADGLPPRMAVQVVQSEVGEMSVERVYVADNDVVNGTNRMVFDLLNVEDAEAFEILIAKDNGYGEEMSEISRLKGRLNKYNSLLRDDRIGVDEHGRIIISPPSPKELKKKDLSDAKGKEGNKTKEDVKEEAKKVVDEEFIPSDIAIG